MISVSVHSSASSVLASTAPPQENRSQPDGLIDRYGRHITYIRLSVTDRCDFRCTYCMSENMRFLPRDQVLRLEEALCIVRAFVDLGVYKVRITGGEPLLRRNLLWLLQRIAVLPGVRELVLTTNGSQLERFAQDLKAAGVKRLNISLDTLDADRFRDITRTGDLDKVIRGIDAARRANFDRIKLNSVLTRDTFAEESLQLVHFAAERSLDIAFIEEMPLGKSDGRATRFVSNETVFSHLGRHYNLIPVTETTGGPARYWQIAGSNSRIGLISPHSHNFCDSCNRVRISAQGDLFPCLGQNDVIALLPILREREHDADRCFAALTAAIIQGLSIKAHSHNFSDEKSASRITRFMSMTGG